MLKATGYLFFYSRPIVRLESGIGRQRADTLQIDMQAGAPPVVSNYALLPLPSHPLMASMAQANVAVRSVVVARYALRVFKMKSVRCATSVFGRIEMS